MYKKQDPVMWQFMTLAYVAVWKLVVASQDFVSNIYIESNAIPLKGKSVVIVCSIPSFNDSVIVYRGNTNAIYDPNSGTLELDSCNTNKCLNKGTVIQNQYYITAGSNSISITILILSRSEHEKYWSCIGRGQTVSSKNQMFLRVYTAPLKLSLINAITRDTDLSLEPVSFTCGTDCAYPSPNFTWFLKESGQFSQRYSKSVTPGNTGTSCPDGEQMYTSTLTLDVNTTSSENLDKTVNFQCQIENFAGLNNTLTSELTKKVRFAVQVTSVTLLNDNTPITNNSMITVANGTFGSLNCIPYLCRPICTVVWYIGQQEVLRGIVLNYKVLFQDKDHHKYIYCKVFNTQPESEAVGSYRLLLDVTVTVSTVELRENVNTPALGTSNITVTRDIPKTLLCVLGTNRPPATVRWNIQGVQTKISDTLHELVFTATDNDHNKQIYCEAYNLQPSDRAVTSNKPYVYVRVNAGVPSLLNSILGRLALFANDTVSMVCKTTLTRPAASVLWTGINVFYVTNVITPSDNDLVYVISTVTFVPTKADHNKNITCETRVDGQETAACVQQTLDVWWPPSKPVISESPKFPWIEGTTNNSLRCITTSDGNPNASTVSWTRPFGTQDSSNNSILIVNAVTYEHDGIEVYCNLSNGFTDKKGLPMMSDNRQLNVNFSPKVLLLDNNNKFTATSGAIFNVTVPIYSKPKDIKMLNITRLVNKVNRLKATNVSANITANIRNMRAVVDGYTILLQMDNVTNQDFGDYSLDISNSIGTLEWSFAIVEHSTPAPVQVVKYLGIINEVPTFYMESGFNGGLHQEFIVETSVDDNVWTERLRFNEFESRFLQQNGTFIFGINGLEPGTYKVRVVASNSLGKAEHNELSHTEPFTITSVEAVIPQSQTAAVVGGAVGGGILAILVIVVLLVLLDRRTGRISSMIKSRKNKRTCMQQEKHTVKKVGASYGDHFGTAGALNDKSKKSDDCNLYSEVDKPKSEGPTGRINNGFTARRTSCLVLPSKPTRNEDKKANGQKVSKNNANEICLVYIDLDFANPEQAKKNIKPAVPSADRAIVYEEVDFTTKGKHFDNEPEMW